MFKIIFVFLLLSSMASAGGARQTYGEGYRSMVHPLALLSCQGVGGFETMDEGEEEDGHVRDDFGNTLLHHGVFTGDVGLVRYLLGEGYEPNVQNNLGDTPLHLAVRNENREMVRLLIDARANPIIPNNEGVTAFDHAVSENNVEYIQLLFYRMVQIRVRDSRCTDGETEEVKRLFQIFTWIK